MSKTAGIKRRSRGAGLGVSVTGLNLAENLAQGVTVATLTPMFAQSPSAISITGATTPANAVQMNVDGRTLESGSVPLDAEVTSVVLVPISFTHAGGTYSVTLSLPVTNVADGPTLTGAATTLAAMVGTPTVGAPITGDLRTLFGAHPLGSAQTFTVSFGTVAGDGFTWNWTPSVAEYNLYGEGNADIVVRATDPSGQYADAELLDQFIAQAILAPINSNTTLTFRVLEGSAPTISSSTPADNTTDVAIDTDPAVTFNKPIAFGASGSITLRNITDANNFEVFDVATEQGTGAGQCSIAGSVLTLNTTSSFANNKSYGFRIDAGAVTNLGGVGVAAITDDTTLNFTTVAAAAGITFKGDKTNTSSTGPCNVTMTGALSGGTGGTLATNDFMLVMVGQATNADADLSVSDNQGHTWTELRDGYANSSNDANIGIFWAKCGATPPTTITVAGSTTAGFAMAVRVRVYSGCQDTTPFIASTVSQFPGTAIPNLPPVTPTIAGSLLLGVAAVAQGSTPTATAFAVGANMANGLTVYADSSSRDCHLLTAEKNDWTSGPFDGDPWTISAGSDSASHAAASSMIIIQP